MEGANGGVLVPTRVDENGVQHRSNKVDNHLNKLLASRLSNPDLTPREVAEASKSAAAAAVIAAKAARATADEKAAAAAKAVAAAKSALDLIASFPIQTLVQDLLYQELPSRLQIGGDVIMSNSRLGKNDQCEVVPIGLIEKPNTEDQSLLVSDRPKDGIQVTRKRGRPKSK